MGRPVLNLKKFVSLCDQFDLANNTRGSREYFFVHSEANILSFVLNKFHVDTTYFPPNSPPDFRDEGGILSECQGFLAFSEAHVWAYRKHGNTWYCLDSEQPKPSTLKVKKMPSDHFGFIVVQKSSKHQKPQNSTAHFQDKTIDKGDKDSEEEEQTEVEEQHHSSGEHSNIS